MKRHLGIFLLGSLITCVAACASPTSVDQSGDEGASDLTDKPVLEVISIDGYPPRFTKMSDIIGMVGIDHVLIVTISGIREPRWNGPGGERPDPIDSARLGRPAYVWTPIDVRVEEVLRGASPGESIVLRSLGGIRDGVQVTSEIGGEIVEPQIGQRLVVFLGEAVDAGDGLSAYTPNAYYTVVDDTATAENHSHLVSMVDLRAEVMKWRTVAEEASDHNVATTSPTTP